MNPWKYFKWIRLIGEQFIEGMFTNAHSYLMESMDRIANITSEIAQVEAEIARLRINKGRRK